MTKEWLTYKLGDIAEIIDCPHSTPKWLDKGVFVIRSWNVRGGRLVFEKASYTDELTYTERTRRARPEPGDIVLTREAPMGEVCIIPEGLKCCLGQRVVLLKPNKTVDNNFLFYTLLSPAIQNKIRSNDGTGSVVSNFRIPDIKALEVKLPSDLNIQKSLASVLSSLDDKIELNLHINKNLEAIAQAIFKEWFIDFRYTEFNRKLGLPLNWKKGTLSDIVKIIKRSIKPDLRDKYEFYLPIDCIDQKTMTLTDSNSTKIANSSLIEFLENDILFGAMRSYFHKVVVAPFNGLTRSTCFVFRPVSYDYLAYAYMVCYQDDSIKYSIQTARGTTMPYAVWDGGMENMPIVIPDIETCRKFNKVVLPIFEKIKSTFFLNKKLREVRDNLLPNLMTGKIRVL